MMQKELTFDQALSVLTQHGPNHVLQFWDQLSATERSTLLAQVAAIDFDVLARMADELKTHLTATPDASVATAVPAPVVDPDADSRASAAASGEAALRDGRIAALLVAGGQGSRLGFEGPKGAYPVGPLSNASLFYFHARKIVALKQRYGQPVPLYIMTSDTNDAATRQFFTDNNNFGLDPADIFFFTQGMWPALDENGKVILETPGRIFMSPDGHGGTISALAANGGIADMHRRGIDTIFYFQVDNPLIEIADPAFIGLHLEQKADISVKVCAKRDPQEGLGVVVISNGKHAMVEYTELSDDQKQRRTANGELYFKYGSVAIHLFSLEFIAREAAGDMPLHVAHKKIPYCDANGTTQKPDTNNGYKFEKFIFDLLPDADKVLCLAFDREEEFAPVKNSTGNDSPATCRAALQAKWRRWLQQIGITIPEDIPIEIDPAYANYPEELRKGLLLHKGELP